MPPLKVLLRRLSDSGQQCSACSRAALLDESVYDEFLDKLKTRVEKIAIGNPYAKRSHGSGGERRGGKVDSQLHPEIGKHEGRLIAGGKRVEGDGYFYRAYGHCRHRSQSSALAGGNFPGLCSR